MAGTKRETIAAFYAETYDAAVPDWPGEIDFYRALAEEVRLKGQALLEIASGTGRVGIRLAQGGIRVVGLDLSPSMLKEAKRKSKGLTNVRWVKGDMRSFDLGEQFGLVLITGHAFQHMNTAADQLACLQCIRRHLLPGGRLVTHLDHPDLTWLGGLLSGKNGVFETSGQFRHPKSGNLVTASQAWTYEAATQTAITQMIWEEKEENGAVVQRLEDDPVPLHCVFHFEMEHVLHRAGYELEAVFGDFFRSPLGDKSDNMIWLARRGA